MESIGINFLNLQYFFLLIYELATGAGRFAIPENVVALWNGITTVSTLLSLLILAGCIYSYIRLRQIRLQEKEKLGAPLIASSREERRNERWARIEELMTSQSENDWRHAILDADVMLDEMVKSFGYQGESLGERLKQIERSDFKTLNEAWEAHKIRNEIAHAGSGYVLDQRTARRAIDLFRSVFQEFFVI